jgi:cell division protein FtsB
MTTKTIFLAIMSLVSLAVSAMDEKQQQDSKKGAREELGTLMQEVKASWEGIKDDLLTKQDLESALQKLEDSLEAASSKRRNFLDASKKD